MDSINGLEHTPSEENKTGAVDAQSGEQDRTVIRDSEHRINEQEENKEIEAQPAEPPVDLSAATNEEAEDSEEEVAFATIKSLTPSFQPGSSTNGAKQEKGKSKRSAIVITPAT